MGCNGADKFKARPSTTKQFKVFYIKGIKTK